MSRHAILQAAGIPHEVEPAQIDERRIEQRAPAGNASEMVALDTLKELDSDFLQLIAADACHIDRKSVAEEIAFSRNAKLLEDAFEQKLSEFLAPESTEAPVVDSSSASVAGPQQASRSDSANRQQSSGIDKSVLAVSAPRRYRNKEHLRFVAQQPCLLCARKPSDAHHLRFVQPRALGRKASDEFAVPLCRIHHRAAHRASDERAWWNAAGIDPVKIARKLWKDTRANKGQHRRNVSLQATPTDPPLTSDGVDGKAS